MNHTHDAGEPGYSVPSCVTPPREVRASARQSVTSLKPWTRNGNMRPRVTKNWTSEAPILTPRTARVTAARVEPRAMVGPIAPRVIRRNASGDLVEVRY